MINTIFGDIFNILTGNFMHFDGPFGHDGETVRSVLGKIRLATNNMVNFPIVFIITLFFTKEYLLSCINHNIGWSPIKIKEFYNV